MTKTFLAITTALALTTPFLATDKKQSQFPVETNNQIKHPLENTSIAGSYSNSYNPGVCTRDGLFQPVIMNEVIVGDFIVPVHCKEPNCGLGVYSPKKDSDEERCSYCNALKPVNL